MYLMNLALFEVERALSDIIGPAIDLPLLQEKADLEKLAFLFNDRAGKATLARRVRSHEGIDRHITLLEKALLLAPRRGDLYKMLNELYAYRGETERQRGLLRRLEHTDLDQAHEISWAKSVYAGGQKEQRRSAASGSILRAESALAGRGLAGAT